MTTITAKAGELARLTAALLADAGLNVAAPAPDDAGGCRLFIWTAGGPDSLTVSDEAHAELQGDHEDPHQAADIAAALLSATPSDARHPDAVSDGGMTFKGIVGMDLKAKGFNVTLDVYVDEFYYDVGGDIAVTNPHADTGTVYVNDDGGLTWFRDLWAAHADTESEPRFRTWLPDPAAVARDIAGTIARALSIRHDAHAAC